MEVLAELLSFKQIKGKYVTNVKLVCRTSSAVYIICDLCE